MATRVPRPLRAERKRSGRDRKGRRVGRPAGELSVPPQVEDWVAIPRRQYDRLLALARQFEPDLDLLAPGAAADALEAAACDTEDPARRLARHIHQLRRRREAYFDGGLFSEPGWDILLDLYVASATGDAVCVSAACAGAAAPQTTALRWLAQLEAQGLILREIDQADARRSHVRLSPDAICRMTKLFHDAFFVIAPDRLARDGDGDPAPRRSGNGGERPRSLPGATR